MDHISLSAWIVLKSFLEKYDLPNLKKSKKDYLEIGSLYQFFLSNEPSDVNKGKEVLVDEYHDILSAIHHLEKQQNIHFRDIRITKNLKESLQSRDLIVVSQELSMIQRDEEFSSSLEKLNRNSQEKSMAYQSVFSVLVGVFSAIITILVFLGSLF